MKATAAPRLAGRAIPARATVGRKTVIDLIETAARATAELRSAAPKHASATTAVRKLDALTIVVQEKARRAASAEADLEAEVSEAALAANSVAALSFAARRTGADQWPVPGPACAARALPAASMTASTSSNGSSMKSCAKSATCGGRVRRGRAWRFAASAWARPRAANSVRRVARKPLVLRRAANFRPANENVMMIVMTTTVPATPAAEATTTYPFSGSGRPSGSFLPTA